MVCSHIIMDDLDQDLMSFGLFIYFLEQGVSYRESIRNICSEVGITANTFYKCLDKLKSAGLVDVVQEKDTNLKTYCLTYKSLVIAGELSGMIGGLGLKTKRGVK